MARKIKQDEYDQRRMNILASAQRLVYTKGYEQISIQDILAELHISKGAFYHYFPSKQALLEGLIELIASQGLQLLEPIAQDETLGATQKLLRVFDFAARWKTTRKEYLLKLVRIWYADENAILRIKTQAKVTGFVNPLLITIIHQGIGEGVFHTNYPAQSCEIIFSLIMSMGDSMIKRLIQPELNIDTFHYLEALTGSYQDAIERVLGAAPGSLPLFDPSILKEWFPPSNGHL